MRQHSRPSPAGEHDSPTTPLAQDSRRGSRIAPTRFWFQWIVANACAELIGLGAVAGLGYLAASRLREAGGLGPAIAVAAVFVALGALEGLVVGLAQNRVLRKALPELTGWVPATVAGAVASWAIGMAPSTIMSALPHPPGAAPPEIGAAVRLLLAAGLGLVAGPILALFQWRRLRLFAARRAWLWLPANGAAWALGMPVIFAAVHLAAHRSEPLAAAGIAGLSLFLSGAIVGAVHGAILAWRILRAS